MDELTKLELMALIGEQQILLAQANKTMRRLSEEIAALKKPIVVPDPED